MFPFTVGENPVIKRSGEPRATEIEGYSMAQCAGHQKPTVDGILRAVPSLHLLKIN